MRYTTHHLHQWRREIGANIHRLRVKKRIPLRKLERLSGVPAWQIDQYELGKGEIRLGKLLRIACALDVRADRLFMSETSFFGG